jgi:hypothetical protein
MIHLCAAGLGPESLRVLMIDPDAANGNGTRVKHLVEDYGRCAALFGGKLGSMPFFSTKLDLVQTENSTQGLNVWNPVASDKTFREILNHALLNKIEQDVTHLFFTDGELDTNLEKGFRGHPAIGAAAMSLLPLYVGHKPWDQISEGIRAELNNAGGARVMVAGSVFGGTGASAIHPLARFLRKIPESNKDRLKIGAVALVPYFQFNQAAAGRGVGQGELAAQADRFALATRAAVEFYQHLRENKDWDFDAMYWLGDDDSIDVPFSIGGERQENPAHVVDLLAAMACLEFFTSPPDTKACQYAGPRSCEAPPVCRGKNVVYWEDVPMSVLDRKAVEARILQFQVMGAMHLGFCRPLFDHPQLDRQPFCVPWYLKRFAERGDYLTKPEAREQLAAFGNFFSRHHLPWWKQVLGVEPERVRLLMRDAFKLDDTSKPLDLYKLGLLAFPKDPGQFDVRPAGTLDFVDRFFSDMVDVAGSVPGNGGASAYVSLLAYAAERFCKREYQKTA